MTTRMNTATESRAEKTPSRLLIVLALLAVYIIWGSTYLGISIAIESIPPLLMAGSRFVISGLILFVIATLRGAPMPTRRQWLNGALFGTMLLGFGNGGVTLAEQSISSGVAAMIVATVPLWVTIWMTLGGKRPSRYEIIGVLLGFAGIILLNIDNELNANGLGIALVIGAAMSWALGTVWKRGADTAPGISGAATEMLCAGVVMLAAGLLRGERLTEMPTRESLLAFVYLFTFGGIIAYTAFSWLVHNVCPTLATSYAYVNPVIAVLLGVALADETIGRFGLPALALVVSGVVLIMWMRDSR
jgi:drug/metabolite transporter (DMT)-like permease